jgi:hypothetical protein
MRKTRSIVWALLLALGVTAAAWADTSTKGGGTGKEAAKGKSGDACKINTDCDQSSRPMRCRESKCEFMPSHPVT